jgi:hypothetical protein
MMQWLRWQSKTENSNIKEIYKEMGEKTMKLTLNAKDYNVTLNDNSTIDDILKLLHMTLEMKLYAGHEYYASLLDTPTKTISDIKAGGIYYWDGWNAFVINFEDTNIALYKVVHIGDINGDIVLELAKSGDSIIVNVQ